MQFPRSAKNIRTKKAKIVELNAVFILPSVLKFLVTTKNIGALPIGSMTTKYSTKVWINISNIFPLYENAQFQKVQAELPELKKFSYKIYSRVALYHTPLKAVVIMLIFYQIISLPTNKLTTILFFTLNNKLCDIFFHSSQYSHNQVL